MRVPLVSVLLPLRDAEETLDACLESLEAQTLGDFEIVAVDHLSVDSTPGLLRRWSDRLPNLRVHRHEAGTLLDALNAGLARCKGRLVARMDGDDLCLPTRLQEQAAYLEAEPELGLIGSRVELFGGEPLSEGWRSYQDWVNSLVAPADILKDRFVECPLPHPTWMARREVYERLGGYQNPDWPEDYHFFLRCVEAGVGIGKHPAPLLRWREHPKRHSRVHARYRREAFFSLKAAFLGRWIDGKGGQDGPRSGKRCVVWGAGDRGRLLVRRLQEAGVEVALCVGLDEPGARRRTEAHGVKVVPPAALPKTLPGPLLVCVGAPGIRAELHAWMAGRRWREGEDYWFAS